MDLYGSGVSIGQANRQTEEVRGANNAATDFNNSLAEQLDQARTAENQDQTAVTSKNLLSVATSGGKLLTSSKARGDLLKPITGFKKGFFGKEVATTAEESIKPGIAGAADVGDLARSGVRSLYSGGLRPSSPTRLGRGLEEAVVQNSGELGEDAGEAGSKLVGRGLRFGAVESSADIAKPALERLGVTGAAKLGGVGLAKVGIAGIGGGIDIIKDIERGKGVFNKDTYGSNNYQRVGNIGNIIGSGLEVAGILTAWTGFGLGLEGVGAAISLGSAALETVGDIDEGDEKAAETEADIKSQSRGQAVAQQVETAVGRSQ